MLYNKNLALVGYDTASLPFNYRLTDLGPDYELGRFGKLEYNIDRDNLGNYIVTRKLGMVLESLRYAE